MKLHIESIENRVEELEASTEKLEKEKEKLTTECQESADLKERVQRLEDLMS